MAELTLNGKQELEAVYSNFDHELVDEVVEKLMQEPDTYAPHYAWNFCAYIWHDDGTWYEQVWQHNRAVETRSGTDLRELVSNVNDYYGHQ